MSARASGSGSTQSMHATESSAFVMFVVARSVDDRLRIKKVRHTYTIV
jgi:hypothetical protein